MSQDRFVTRHIGPRGVEIAEMLEYVGVSSMEELLEQTVPSNIRLQQPLKMKEGLSERKYFRRILELASMNKVFNTYIGMGYYDTITPAVVLRNVLENPVWYTSYTPYQAEISQGRLEALLNFQTMVCGLTGMDIANASLLDEATAAAEAMVMMANLRSRKMVKAGMNTILVDEKMWPQTHDVLKTRALPLGFELKIQPKDEFNFDENVFGVIVQYPNSDGEITDYAELVEKAHEKEIKVAVAADLMSLAILMPPGEWGADIVFGNSQRFGVPMGYGGPHAAFFAAREEFKRNMPGRIIGVTKDIHGNRALRMALQTREQHIKREKATSNICTAQALLAIMAGFFGVYHGPEGVIGIAERIHNIAAFLAIEIEKLGYTQINKNFFDTIRFALPKHVMREDIEWLSLELEMNFRYFENGDVGISIDETTNPQDIGWIIEVFAKAANKKWQVAEEYPEGFEIDAAFKRTSKFMTEEVFNKYRSETEMVRYIKRLAKKDISLTQSMISLGSCTMKLNAATEMLPLSWIEFNGLHPFVPKNQARGYHEMMEELRRDLSEITGMADVSLQPNSGAAGEYAGLMVIQEYHKSRGEGQRDVVIIPSSAHGTNPASAVMAGTKVVVVKCDEKGNVDMDDLRAKAELHKDRLSAFMVTYPSTHGVFEASIIEMCEVIHENGGQVYMDGANMNAQVGLTNPRLIGADVCHLNLHKTFAIPHGGGGPGVGPIGVASHLVEFLPSHPIMNNGHVGITAVSAAPWGSASVLPITYGYIKMMGAEGLTEATKLAILNANYIATALKDNYGILYTGENGRVAHELILECRHLKASAGITEEDIAKRLMDYGFHAPTLSFPVHGTLMIEPTESESKDELDRFISALNSIFEEVKEVENGVADKADNVLKNAPHTAQSVCADEWTHAYGREKAAYPLDWVRENKYWVPVGRVDNAWGDRNLICTCGSPEEYEAFAD
ncbi:glycine dehydrogenase (decarboxylating) alpha subunit /glycine dehydrogenase (decarboxylating) beta subunit [Draconibacterium orientale]|uniref:Glycine dehydrogenase (decarboxylating) n=1 Tax=Draconibacterium orientale TaxID=1168034 RepID=X5DI12_9BACT|nr:aminomethyl-transferring glycine dehydrogenase [Draconibacterium orientale]AHW60142.1 glycine dehydrogenase [Draconibacterium orientale]SES99243.1 glycine dehydrogenase (decarboxylating) alpha subunit /glycine dehydrogenase (decarboxylating) beta subunit [Draconibacterium orientale]